MARFELSVLFQPHPNLSDEINADVIRSEVEGAIHLRELPAGAVSSQSRPVKRQYTIVNQGAGDEISSAGRCGLQDDGMPRQPLAARS